MTNENDKTPEAGSDLPAGVVLFPASCSNSTKEPAVDVSAEPEIYELISSIIVRAEHFEAKKDRAVANMFYNLLPQVNDLNRKLKELRKNVTK